MIDIIDFDACQTNERNGTYGGQAGSKEGITYNGDYWMIKYPKSTKGMRTDKISYTTSPLSEFIGSHIYDILGFDVHETFLGKRNGKIVVACKDFCEREGSLREIRALKNVYNESLERILERELPSTSSDRVVDLNEIQIHLENNPVLSTVSGLTKRFWDCVIVDGLINNNDRNNGNWGLLYKDGRYEIAPVYDNGAAFSNKLSDQQITKRMADDANVRKGSLEIETTYGIDDSKLKFRELLQIDNDDLREAIIVNVPRIREHMDEIESFINSIPEEYENLSVISADRKAFYIKGMRIRLAELLEPAYEKSIACYQPKVQMEAQKR